MKTFKLFNFNERTAMVQAEGCTNARQKIGVNPRTTSTIGRFASVLCIILIMLLTLGVGQMWADVTHPMAVADNNPNDYTVKVEVNIGDYGTKWMYTFTKAGITFEGKQLHCGTFNRKYDGIDGMDVHHYQGDTWKEKKSPVTSYKALNVSDDGITNRVYNWDNNTWYSKLTFQKAYIYFDATDWNSTNIKYVIGHANFQRYYGMENVEGTKLYYDHLDINDAWNDAMGCGVVGNTSASDGENWLTNVSSKASEYTGFRNYGMNNSNASTRYLIVNHGSSGEQPDVNFSEDYTDLNNTQTYNTVVKAAGGSYTSANSKATINISSYELTSQGGTTGRTPELSTSESSETVSACRTATTRLQVGTPATGYQFDGWYTGATGGTLVSESSDYTYYPTSANTYYARFSEKTYSVAFTNDGHGSVTSPAATPQTVGQLTGISINASANTGYKFVNWTISSGTGSFTSATTTASNTFKPTAAATIRANFTPKSCSVTFQKYSGIGGDDGTTATYDAAMTTVSVPHKIGYKFDGYYDSQTDGNGSGTKYYNADGTSAKTWDKNTESATTLYAKWVSDTKTFNGGGSDKSWTTAENWSGGVPSDDWSSVTINAEVELSSAIHIGQLSIGASGKLIIKPTGALEVAGTITNTDASKLEIQTTTSSQGALIYDIASPPAATVNMTLNGSGFHLIASPTGGARVSSTFAGSGIYTYAWEEGKGWDRRGYYDDFVGNEAILIYGQTICNFSGTLANYCGGSLRYTDEPDDASAQGVNMLANPLTAPIRIANMTISNSEDGAVHLYNGSWVGKAPGSAGEAVIPAMQGYGVIASSSGGTVSFDYDVAVRRASSKNAPLNAPKRTDSDIQDHISVSVTTNDRKVDLELYENAQFTEGIDVGWEAIYMEGSGQFGELYAIADKKMNILATPNLEGTVLGFVPGQAESYVISFEGDGKGYYLNDTELELSTLIDEGNTYEFTPNESTNATRFVISKTPIRNTPTGLEEVSEGTKARKQLIDGVLYIIRDGRIYNTTGALYK